MLSWFFLCFHGFVSSWVEQDPSDPLSSLSTQFLRGLLSLGQLQQRNTLSGKAMSAEQVYHTYVTNQKFLLSNNLTFIFTFLLSVCVGSQLQLAVSLISSKVSAFTPVGPSLRSVKAVCVCLCAGMLQRSSADCPECESVCVSRRGERAAGVGAPGCSICPAPEADPAGRAPGQGWHREAVPGGKEMPGPHSSHTPHLYRPLSGAAGHAGAGRSTELGL